MSVINSAIASGSAFGNSASMGAGSGGPTGDDMHRYGREKGALDGISQALQNPKDGIFPLITFGLSTAGSALANGAGLGLEFAAAAIGSILPPIKTPPVKAPTANAIVGQGKK